MYVSLSVGARWLGKSIVRRDLKIGFQTDENRFKHICWISDFEIIFVLPYIVRNDSRIFLIFQVWWRFRHTHKSKAIFLPNIVNSVLFLIKFICNSYSYLLNFAQCFKVKSSHFTKHEKFIFYKPIFVRYRINLILYLIKMIW